MNWSDTILSQDCVISDAIKSLDKTGKIVMIVDANNRLIGTISDGDIRRGMLKGYSLETPIQNILHKDDRSTPICK